MDLDVINTFLAYCDIAQETLPPQYRPVVREYIEPGETVPRGLNQYNYEPSPVTKNSEPCTPESIAAGITISEEQLANLFAVLGIEEEPSGASPDVARKLDFGEESTKPSEVPVGEEGTNTDGEEEIPVVVEFEPDALYVAKRPVSCPDDFRPIPEKIILPDGKGEMPFFAWVPLYKRPDDTANVAVDVSSPMTPGRLERLRGVAEFMKKDLGRGDPPDGSSKTPPRTPVKTKKDGDADLGHGPPDEEPALEVKRLSLVGEVPSPKKQAVEPPDINLRPQSTLVESKGFNKGKRMVREPESPGGVSASPLAKHGRVPRFNSATASEPGVGVVLKDFG